MAAVDDELRNRISELLERGHKAMDEFALLMPALGELADQELIKGKH